MKYTFSFILVLSFCCNSVAGTNSYILGVSTVESGSVTCSGDMSNGDNESFESGVGAFCTTDWTESDTDGVINTYSNSNSFCGSYSMAVTCDSDNSASANRAYVDFGVDTDLYFRVYMTFPTLLSGDYIRPLNVNDQNNEAVTAGTLYLQIFNSSGTYQVKLRDANENPSEYFDLSAGTQYRFEFHSVSGSTSTMRAYTSAGTAIETSNGGGDYEISVTSGATNTRYLIFHDYHNDSSAVTYYVDDVIIDLDGTGYIGAQTCN